MQIPIIWRQVSDVHKSLPDCCDYYLHKLRQQIIAEKKSTMSKEEKRQTGIH